MKTAQEGQIWLLAFFESDIEHASNSTEIGQSLKIGVIKDVEIACMHPTAGLHRSRRTIRI
ncbi:MAG TPA: hypothetical protein ENJ18_08350 [Nannocystis exedens]|nr:hypothetical protein [Nannocystis exedens]